MKLASVDDAVGGKVAAAAVATAAAVVLPVASMPLPLDRIGLGFLWAESLLANLVVFATDPTALFYTALCDESPPTSLGWTHPIRA